MNARRAPVGARRARPVRGTGASSLPCGRAPLGLLGIPLQEQLLMSLVLCVLCAHLARKLHATEALRMPEAP